ncbi:YhcN/YlaJ family sporulation lipoprotein [Ectobacillus sp. JY-23]|uniref:YhcN/YlaJ family sporulation lipoprotein n=1 Tax=Ectobacillus sp. JY-23 TaxID=2933872 RepID=UPI001FF1366B|nr:YhcN/YlaJ family sporulation lipoprotein [Ectobacillus sp. JY-23]UOY94140.1 YhcN/YlaJ family sporulation lipoprotein [Ectobacillus sp. JY-23]
MNKKLKIVATSLLAVGVLAACNTDKKDTAMERYKEQTADDFAYERTSYYGFGDYPNSYGYGPRPASITDRYSDLNMNRVAYREPKTDHYGNVKYTKINQDIHKNKEKVGYNYYGDRNFHSHLDNSYPTRNVTMNGYYTNGDGATSEKITNRVKRLNEVDRVSTVVYGNDVLVAVKSDGTMSEGKLKDKIRQVAMPYTKGRNLQVAVNESMYNRVNKMNTNLRDGTMTNDMNKDLEDMFRSVRSDYNRMTR